ncbi:MAG: hypothetical protein Q8P24_14465 [Desulfobacterales bacterium]|nr:hypothetical protein [Desulfobacterales bacterium]
MELFFKLINGNLHAFYDKLVFKLTQLKWAGLRILFFACTAFSMLTLIGGFFLAPFYTYWFFGTFKFWKYLRLAPRLVFYISFHFPYILLKGTTELPGFLFTPPKSDPDLTLVQLNPAWKHGASCHDCCKCCQKIKCPLLEPKTLNCLSYDSLFWRYFNCSRYPASQVEIDRYQCPKWVVRR